MLENLSISLIFKESRYTKLAFYLGIVGGVVSQFIGGFDELARLLLIIMSVDVLAGVLGALKEKKLDSRQMYWGIIRKIVMFIVVGLAFQLQRLLPATLVLRETVLYFYLSKEGLSVIENIGKIIELPPILTQYFYQLKREEGDEEDE